jgi:hypothetical protein
MKSNAAALLLFAMPCALLPALGCAPLPAKEQPPASPAPGATAGAAASLPGYAGFSSLAQDEFLPTVHCKLHEPRFGGSHPEPRQGGAWESVVPNAGSAAVHNILGMQTVHTVMLPSGRILLISGSSWRNRTGIEYYPTVQNPKTPNGLFIRDEDPFRNDKLDVYYDLVNNAAIYDPKANTFYRIPVPVPEPDPNVPGHFAPNDFFCTGHQHLRDGNVLLTGGTQYYSPYRTGNNTSYIFDWRTELHTSWEKVDWRVRPASNAGTPWTFAGFMKRGRWYPSLLPLLDGRLAVFSGFVGFDKGFPDMHVFEINTWVETFDSSAFTAAKPEAAWRAVDVAKVAGGPFTTLINPDFKPTPDVACDARCVESNKYDAFKLYPQNYLLPDGRIYLTREGDWVSLRTCDTAFMRRTKHTYFATLGDGAAGLQVGFEKGPDRVEDVTSYGTTFLDRASGQIHLLGGQPTSPGTLYPLNADKPSHFAGGRGSARLETFTPDRSAAGGSWTLDPHFLGDGPEADRTMHYTVALPTGQMLLINGGNYDFYGPTFGPIMLTPQVDPKTGARKGYKRERMLEALEPRLYHNAAMLLPDGRVFVSGGNTARATVTPRTGPPEPFTGVGQPKPDLGRVDTGVYFFDDGPMAKGLPGQLTTPTENWTAEIFSPPYLFIDGPRRAAITALGPVGKVDFTAEAKVDGQTFALFHSNTSYQLGLKDLPTTCDVEKGRLVLIKLPSATHGWENGQQSFELTYRRAPGGITFTTPRAKAAMIPPAFYMLFYTDCAGKPVKEASMVRFDDAAKAP